MLFQKTLFGLGLLTGLASAAPSIRRRQSPGALNVVYWGQNGGGTIENNDLSAYCTATSDIDVLVLSSLWQWSNGATAMGGSFGQSVCPLSSLSLRSICSDNCIVWSYQLRSTPELRRPSCRYNEMQAGWCENYTQYWRRSCLL